MSMNFSLSFKLISSMTRFETRNTRKIDHLYLVVGDMLVLDICGEIVKGGITYNEYTVIQQVR